MFLFMFFFYFWVHGVSYRFHALEIPLLTFIIGSRLWMDNQEYFKASLRKVFFCGWAEHILSFMTVTMDIYISSSSMNHRISSLLIFASCKSAYNLLPSFDCFRLCPYCLLQYTIESTLPSATLLSSTIYNWLSCLNRVHAFVLVVVISLSLVSSRLLTSFYLFLFQVS
jgi:hypothetical protein